MATALRPFGASSRGLAPCLVTFFRPSGASACSHGWSEAALGLAQPVESVCPSLFLIAPKGRRSRRRTGCASACRALLCPAGAGFLFARPVHGLRCARLGAGCALPVATSLRPVGACSSPFGAFSRPVGACSRHFGASSRSFGADAIAFAGRWPRRGRRGFGGGGPLLFGGQHRCQGGGAWRRGGGGLRLGGGCFRCGGGGLRLGGDWLRWGGKRGRHRGGRCRRGGGQWRGGGDKSRAGVQVACGSRRCAMQWQSGKVVKWQSAASPQITLPLCHFATLPLPFPPVPSAQSLVPSLSPPPHARLHSRT